MELQKVTIQTKKPKINRVESKNGHRGHGTLLEVSNSVKQNFLNSIAEINVSYKPTKPAGPRIDSSSKAHEYLRMLYSEERVALQEQFIILYLNRANQVLGAYHAFTGGITGTVADIRIIMGVALKSMACGMVISHNHPSGSLKPSSADKHLTEKIKEAGKLMDINLLDHIIVSPEGGYYSFADEGLI
jgi:DNA repair protein RadC